MVTGKRRRYIFAITLLATFLTFGPQYGMGQDSVFTVTVEEKTSEHPYSDQGWSTAYAIDGDLDPDLVLKRGNTYEFRLDGVDASHPFYMSLSEMGLGEEPYDQGVENNNATGNDTLVFTPDSETPDSLFYQCKNHSYMGNVLYIEGEGTHMRGADRQPQALELKGNYPNPFNPSTKVYFDLRETARVKVTILDISGRQVMEIPEQTVTAGENRSIAVNAGKLSSGLYLYQLTARQDLKSWTRWGKMTLLK